MSDRVRDACDACFPQHRHDCSGFVRAVGATLGVEIVGNANAIVDTIRAGGEWRPLADGTEAAASAAAGKLVIGGLRGDEQAAPNVHGHAVVVVTGPLARGLYPHAYWGALGGDGAAFDTVNFAWVEADRDRVSYAEREI